MVRAADFGIMLEDIAITHLSFGTEFTRAVESKQVAEQDAERARFVVLKAEQVRTRMAGCIMVMGTGLRTSSSRLKWPLHCCHAGSRQQAKHVRSTRGPSMLRHAMHLLTMQERNAAIIRAEGESEAAKLISDATKAAGAGLVELRRIEAARDIAETMAKSANVVYLPSGGKLLLGINPVS